MSLSSFGSDLNTVVFGASGGIGAAFAEALEQNPCVARVHRVSRSGSDYSCDYQDEDSICAVAEALAESGPLDLVLVAIGVLHGTTKDGTAFAPEKTWRALDAEAMAHVYAANAIAPVMIAKHMLPRLAKGKKTAFAALSARVGSISDNRLGGWLSYRASKAALNMSIKTLSIELARINPDALIAGLHPGTVATDLSAPFQANVPEGRLFTPDDSARQMLCALDAASPGDSGALLAYDGAPIPP